MKIEKKVKKEKGSALVLTLIAVLILSIMVTGLLNVGTTEIYSTQNFHLNKAAYYTAVQGVEELRARIAKATESGEISNIAVLPPTEAYSYSGGFLRFYITGSLNDMEDIIADGTQVVLGGGSELPEGVKIEEFFGFEPPHVHGGDPDRFLYVIWKVQVTAKVQANKRSTYSEIIAGVVSISESAGSGYIED